MSNRRFGDYLAQLLREQACSGSRLASMLGIDPALIYRWLRNEAVPKLDTAYCHDIAQKLHLTQTELSQLKDAQVYSLSKPLERRPKTRSGSAAVERLLRQAAPRPRASTTPLAAPQTLTPRESGVIWGRPALLETMISLLDNLPTLSRFQSQTLLFTFQGAENVFDDFPALQEQFTKTLDGVLQRGWKICHLWRLNQDVPRSIYLVENMLKLLGTGRYLPHYISEYGTLSAPYDLLIVPGTAAMLFFATQNPRRDDAALLTHDQEQIELFRTHFYQLYAMSQPLAQTYLPEDGVRNWQALAEAENTSGGRMVVKDGLSFLTEPPEWYSQDWMRKDVLKLQGQVLTETLEHQYRRFAAFQANIATSSYRDICPRRAIERLVRDGAVPNHDRYPPGYRLSPQARREQLERTLYLLRTYQRYEIALIDEEEEQFVPAEMFWEVGGQKSVVMLSWSTDMKGTDIIIQLVINEPTIVHSFYDYFEELWERITPEHRDKTQVIAWLEQQLAQLSKSVA